MSLEDHWLALARQPRRKVNSETAPPSSTYPRHSRNYRDCRHASAGPKPMCWRRLVISFRTAVGILAAARKSCLAVARIPLLLKH